MDGGESAQRAENSPHYFAEHTIVEAWFPTRNGSRDLVALV
jgi:hypothetical protein